MVAFSCPNPSDLAEPISRFSLRANASRMADSCFSRSTSYLRYFSKFFMKELPLPSFHFGMNTSAMLTLFLYFLFSFCCGGIPLFCVCEFLFSNFRHYSPFVKYVGKAVARSPKRATATPMSKLNYDYEAGTYCPRSTIRIPITNSPAVADAIAASVTSSRMPVAVFVPPAG